MSTSNTSQNNHHQAVSHLATDCEGKQRSASCRSAKIVCGVLFLFGAVVVLSTAVTCAIIFLGPLRPERQLTSPGSHGTQQNDMDVPNEEQQATAEVQRRRASSRPGSREDANRNLTQDCYGQVTNDSYTAAHIVGIGRRWNIEGSGEETDSLSQGYQTSWLCQGKYDAFVDGGMFFNQTEEKLQVPECGYYYIASKISFQVSENTTQFVKHEILVDRNCSDPMTQFRLRSHASVGAGKNIYASTFIGDTIKICAGGKISVFIPTRQTPCCPYGDSIATYLSVHLVQKTGCGRPSITSSRN